MKPPGDPLDAALSIGAALESNGVPYAIGGALAYGLWAIPRATMDVDVNVFVSEDETKDIIALLQNLGVSLNPTQAAAEALEEGMFQGYWGDIRIDVFVPSIPFAWEAMKTRREHSVEGQRLSILSPEALAVFKLLFFRTKDLADLERLLLVQKGKIDQAYVRRALVGMMGETDERVVAWDRLVDDAGLNCSEG